MLLRLVLALVLMTTMVEAQPWSVRVETIPRHCVVVAVDKSGENQVLAKHGEVIVLGEGDFDEGGKIKLKLEKPGYQALEFELDRTDLSAPQLRWPVEPTRFLRLQPVLVSATFETQPRGAQVLLLVPDGSPQHLGLSGRPLWLSLSSLLGQSENGFFRIQFRHPGYQTVTVPVEKFLFGQDRPNRWPMEGSYSLQPAGHLAYVSSLLLGTKLKAGSILGLLALGGWLLSSAAASKRIRLTRAQRIEDLTATTGGRSLERHRLGGFRLLEKLGQGGTATVYRAVPDDSLDQGQECAVKVLEPQSFCRSAANHFRQEVQALLELNHPRIVRLDDWGEQGGLLYFVTELIQGESLRHRLHMSNSKALQVLEQILEGLDHAHKSGIVHRDLKPENVMLGDNDQVKLLDFGLAVPHTDKSQPAPVFGTPGYLAPEQILHDQTGPLSDQYSFGVLAYELLTGQRPFSEDRQSLTESAPTPENLPAPISYWLSRLLKRHPHDRFPDIETALESLRALRRTIQ